MHPPTRPIVRRVAPAPQAAQAPAPAPQVATPGREPVTVPLAYPIQAHGQIVDHLVLRRPTMGDLMECDGLGEITMAAKLIERLAGIPPSSVKAIDAEDFGTLAQVIEDFFPKSPQTGNGD